LTPRDGRLHNYKLCKSDKWPQLKTWAQMLEVWERIKLRTVEEEQPQPPTRTDSDENVASAALLQLLEFDQADKDEELAIEQVGV
jgi:hypothetical protein